MTNTPERSPGGMMSETETAREEAITERLAEGFEAGPWWFVKVLNGTTAHRHAADDIRYLLTRVQHLTQALEEIRDEPASMHEGRNMRTTADRALTPTTPEEEA